MPWMIWGPGGRRFLLLLAWKAVICDLESSDGPARAEGAIDRVAAAVCRSRVDRRVDAILLEDLAESIGVWRATEQVDVLNEVKEVRLVMSFSRGVAGTVLRSRIGSAAIG